MQKLSESPEFNWSEEYLKYLTTKPSGYASPAMGNYMKAADSFLPPALGNFGENDLSKMLQISDLVHLESQKIAFYQLYKKIIDKIAVLISEQFPEGFANLPDTYKDRLFGAKISSPNEQALYNNVYVYLLRRKELPTYLSFGGVTLRDLLVRIQETEPKAVDARLIDLICALDSQYKIYFLDQGKK